MTQERKEHLTPILIEPKGCNGLSDSLIVEVGEKTRVISGMQAWKEKEKKVKNAFLL